MDRGNQLRQRVLTGLGKCGFAWAATLLLLLAGAGCDLFDTRTPNKPESGSIFVCLTLETPDKPYQEITRSYGRGAGLGCYLAALDNAGFRFHGDPTDSTNDPAHFQNWDKNVEDAVSSAIISAVDSISLTMKQPYELTLNQPDVQTRRYGYEIRTKPKPGTIPDTLFQGFAEITVRKNGGQWYVTDWYDRQDPGGTTLRTWGYLRANNRQLAP